MVDFSPLALAHLPLLHGWLQRPHVREFWDDGDRTPQQVRAHYFASEREVLSFIIRLDGQEAGYIQAYPVTLGSDYAPWRREMGETWGIDLFIGEAKWLGQGHAAPIIRAFLTQLRRLRPELARVLIDPAAHNERARRAYAKAGFDDWAQLPEKGLVVMGSDL